MPESQSFYLGPTKQRLIASSWDDVAIAAASGVLDETHWAELKQDIPPTSKPANRELAKDLASLSVDGGVLVVGIEDDDGKAGEVVGTECAGLADRVAQVAVGSIHPPLVVTTRSFPHPDQPDRGLLLVTVPASLGAPHMVDGSYWGRGDKGKRKLGDDEVRRLLDVRLTRDRGFEARLRALSDDIDPVPASARRFGHLYLLIEPATAMVDRQLTQIIAGRPLLAFAADAVSFPAQWRPDITGLHYEIAHPHGIAGSAQAPTT